MPQLRSLTWLILAGVLSIQPVSAQTSLRISGEDGAKAAFTLLYNGYPTQARDLARAILERAPQDVLAEIALSRSERVLGNFDAAIQAGKRAFSLAETDETRFAAALVTAQAYSSDSKRTRAMFWLRRAAEIAPDEARKAQALRDFRYVRGRNPLATTLSFTAQPSSNVNNGSKSDTLVIDGLPFAISGDARALSGVEYRLAGRTAFTKQLDENRLLRFGVRFETRQYTLSNEAKAQAPDLDASDLAYSELEFSVGHTWRQGLGKSLTDLSFDIGRTWYGGDPLSNYLRASVQHRQGLTKSVTGIYNLSATKQMREDSATNDSTEILGRGSWVHVTDTGSVFGWSLGLRDSKSDSATLSHDAILLGMSYQPKAEILGTRAVFSLDMEKRDYDKPLFGVLRNDNRLQANVSILIQQFDYYGFAPTLNINYSQTHSNISLYDAEELGVSLGIKSTF